MWMKAERFFCKKCHRLFEKAKIYDEKHGLDAPPYERIAVCPICNGDDFLEHNTVIEKNEVAEKILPAIAAFNRFEKGLNNLLGNNAMNEDFKEGLGLITELISEMFCFIDSDVEKKFLRMESERDVDTVLLYLKG